MAFKSLLVFFVPLIIYFLMRIKSGAFSPLNAPKSYSIGFNPFLFLRNFWEYFLRAGLFDVYIIVWFLLLFAISNKKIKLLGIDFKAVKLGIIWFICLLLPVLLLHVRSDLYVYFSQLGVHLIFISIFFSLWENLKFRNYSKIKQFFSLSLIFTLLIIWIGFYFVKIRSYGTPGYQSQIFTQEVGRIVPILKKNSHLFVFDLNGNYPNSPKKTISYGFDSLLKMYYFYPYKKISGKIMLPNDFSKIDNYRNSYLFLFWDGIRLIGPYDSANLKYLMFYLCPFKINFSNLDLKFKRETKYRLKKFQKRNRGLMELKNQKKRIPCVF